VTEPSRPRPRPCASCPYRCDVPSGVWAADEYDKLARYDGETFDQSPQPFACHQGSNTVELCSGWVAHSGEPGELLAIRIGILNGSIDPATADYTTDVPLFTSGAEAAAHGKRDILNPSEKAANTIDKVTRVRALRGGPVGQSTRQGPDRKETPMVAPEAGGDTQKGNGEPSRPAS